MRGHLFRPVFLIILCLALPACARYGVRELSPLEQSRQVSRNATNSDEISHLTRRYVLSENLEEKCENEALICILDIDTDLRSSHEAILAIYAAELAFQAAKDHEVDEDTFARLNTSAMVYASAYLFDSSLKNRPSDFHPAQRLAIDIYNRSLAQVMRHLHSKRALTGATHRLPLMRGSLQVRLNVGVHYLPRSFLHIRVAYDYEARGFANHQSYFGLGAPLILLRPYVSNPLEFLEQKKSDPNLKYPPGFESDLEPVENFQYLGKADQAYPATVLFDYDGDYLSKDKKQYDGEFRIIDSLSQELATLNGREVPLESDFSSPMAYMLSGVEERDSLFRRLDGDSINETSGLYMLYPYDKDKIPVVFVHGLASSPMTWFTMINELIADPEIRSRYQFWVYWYPTSNPVVFSAADLRKTLSSAQKRFGFRRMVLIGHSMGGLLSRLMIQRSRTQDWVQGLGIDPQKFADIDLETREVLQQATNYDPLPFVERVIFLATPHRGSSLADGLAGYLGRRAMTVPTGVAELFSSGLSLITGKEDEPVLAAVSGIESLSPDSLFVRVTMNQPFAPGVPYHSIIGNRSATDLDWITDSVVPYASSHLAGAESELLVESDHSVHATMPAILEVRRILRLHLETDFEQARSPGGPLQMSR
ncbi:MAG: hypothetical protein CMN77_17135 [Spirochaetaceae bacterium]|nr:hypothetical protein [Spirochaetaceae bacterium]|tara:strand:- start:10952 stop:12901 length:1950 start_codon:yes stop_codon:yes gene_type:complete